jgi:hypothetical protein
VLRNGVDLKYYRPRTPSPGRAHRLHRDDGLLPERRRLPLLRERGPTARAQGFPRAKFTIVGANPTPEVRKLGAPSASA